jgi:ATP-dependent RNA helicase RhlE
MNQFSELPISPYMQARLAAGLFSIPTPVQEQAIPAALDGKDIFATAQTGTGKTLAFLVPLMDQLLKQKDSGVTVLILVPTRELAMQVAEQYDALRGSKLPPAALVMGGTDERGQLKQLRKARIVVATPGRLEDFLDRDLVSLRAVQTFVLDEADRMFDMGFIRDVRKIVGFLPKERQSMLFSATMPDDVVKLVGDVLKSPERIEVAPQGKTADRVEQKLYYVPMQQKRQLLSELLKDVSLNRVIVFTRTKHGANRVAEHLSRTGVASEAIHGNKSQNARQRALDMFKTGKARVLVATDIAARGIDIDDISHVVNFELPNEPESYVHRIGRTARAGGAGIAISFCDPSERTYLRDIERIIRMKIEAVAHELPELTPEQIKAQEERRPPHGHRHGGKPGNKSGGHRHGGPAPADAHAPKKRNGSRPHWQRGKDKKRGNAA